MSLKNKYQMLVSILAKENTDVVPAGWQTIEQISKETGKSVSQVTKVLKRGIDKKIVQTKKYRILTGSRTFPVVHYKFL